MFYFSLLLFILLIDKFEAIDDNINNFVTTNNSKFYLNNKPFYFAGANCYDLFTYGSTNGTDNFINITKIDEHMKEMSNNHVSVVRTWGFNTQNDGDNLFEKSLNNYNELEFELFDYIIFSATKYNIKLIVSLENYWSDYGGITQRLNWSDISVSSLYPTIPNQGEFFLNEDSINSYLNYIEHFITRINHLTNISYANTTTILAWEVMNEPRYEGYGDDIESKVLRNWMDRVGEFIKNIDSNHLVGSGIEGHGDRYMGSNEGNNFIVIHSSPYIDYCSAHPYPTEEYYNLTIQETQAVVKSWIHDCQNILKKPMFIGEFNVYNDNWSGNRSEWWKGIYQTIEEEDGAGDAFWWFQSSSSNDQTYGVSDGSPELLVFQNHSINLIKKNIL